MAVTIQTRRDDAVDWATANPVLALGEIGIETDTSKAKYGDGFTAWNDLGYWIVPDVDTPVAPGTADGNTLRWEADTSTWDATSNLLVTDDGTLSAGQTGGFVAAGTAPANSLVVTDAGKVGIGTPEPTGNLTVQGDDAANGVLDVRSGGDGANNARLNFGDVLNQKLGRINYAVAADVMNFETAGGGDMRLDAAGSLLVGLTTGGLGAGTVNVSGGYYVNGTPVALASALVAAETRITDLENQLAALVTVAQSNGWAI